MGGSPPTFVNDARNSWKKIGRKIFTYFLTVDPFLNLFVVQPMKKDKKSSDKNKKDKKASYENRKRTKKHQMKIKKTKSIG